MYTVKKILVPTDFSENAATAYNVAHQLAKRFEARIDFIHVIQTLNYYTRSLAKLQVPDKSDEELYPQLQKQASHRIKKLMNDYLTPDHKGNSVVLVAAKPFMGIANYAEQEEYDLVVMATLGEDDSNFMIGSVAEKVVRYSKVPVLTTGQSNIEGIENIMVPLDGSRLSFKALPMAISMASAFDANIILFHVHQLPGTVVEEMHASPYEIDEKSIRDALYADLEDVLSDFGDNIKLQRGDDSENRLMYKEGGSSRIIDVNMVIETDVSPHHKITEYAAENADMLIMTTHGRSGMAHVFIGSTAENVVRHVQLPVLTVKPDWEEVSHSN